MSAVLLYGNKTRHLPVECSVFGGFSSGGVIREFNTQLLEKMAPASDENKMGLVSIDETRRFMTDCFLRSKTSPENAKAMADLLAEADYRGHFSHGMNRLEMYINDLHKNSTDGMTQPEILNETPATAWVDGKNGLGAVVGNFCMDLAIKKAKQVGVAVVAAKRSNHYGIAGWYTMRAIDAGMIGLSGTNTSPLMAPTRAIEAGLGTNPLSFGAPANNGDSFVLDMATTAVAVGKIEIERRKGKSIPEGWAFDTKGNMTTDGDVAFTSGCLAPLGGSEITSGFKGYGLAAMVDILCGVLAGSLFSNKVRKWTHVGSDAEANLGQFFIAIDPNCFAPGFKDRQSEMNEILRNLTPVDPNKPVLVAGDPERNHMRMVDEQGGVQYTPNQIKTCEELSKRLNIAPLKFNN